MHINIQVTKLWLRLARRASSALLSTAMLMLCTHGSKGAEIICGTYARIDPDPSLLADFFPSGRLPVRNVSCSSLLLKGSIERGDAEKLSSLLALHHPFTSKISLWSRGGSVEEAMKIGRVVRRELLITEAPDDWNGSGQGYGRLFAEALPNCRDNDDCLRFVCHGANCHCASACFIVWAAGIRRDGSAIGLHRPSTQSTTFSSLPPERASVLYRQLLADIRKYLSDMEITTTIIDKMLATLSAEIAWLAPEELDSAELVPSIEEWILASCGTFGRAQTDMLMALAEKKSQSQQERSMLKQLLNIKDQVSRCWFRKIYNARDAAH